MDDVRYGVFLRPDPATCWAVTQITDALRAQFALVSAGAFPPHATLVGNLRAASAAAVEAAIDEALDGVDSFPLHNAGVVADGPCWLMDVHSDGAGDVNGPLTALAARVRGAVLPLALPREDYLVGPLDSPRFWAHLSLASHDLLVDPRLSSEVGEYIAGLPITWPSRSVAEVVSLFAFTADWERRWWDELRWTHLRSWMLPVRKERGNA